MKFANFLCRIGLHPWYKWEQMQEGNIKHTGGKAVIGRFFLQGRTCSNCKKKQVHTQSFTIEDVL